MNKQEAAEYLNISVRTLQRLTADGALIAGMVKGKTGLVTDYTKDDLDAYKKRAAEPQQRDDTRYVKPHVIPSDAPSQALERQGGIEGMQAFASMIADALRGAQTQGKAIALPSIADLSHKLMLTEREAAAYSGLSLADIERARGALNAIRTGAGWRVKREEVERYVKKL
jgi:excisionase family DNA binding protein